MFNNHHIVHNGLQNIIPQ